MKPGFIVPKGALDNKPRHGEPCNGCGLCCVATLCPLGAKLFNRERGPCPALVQKDKQYGCGVVADPMRYAMAQTLQHGAGPMREAALLLIGSGTGCDARFNGEPPNEDFYRFLEDFDRRNKSRANKARRLWGI